MIEAIQTSDVLAMWLTFAVIAAAMVFYATEWASLELTSIGAVLGVMLIGVLLPQSGIEPEKVLAGFANPALLTILALLVMGQALIQTEAISGLADYLGKLWPTRPTVVVLIALGFAGLDNNTPGFGIVAILLSNHIDVLLAGCVFRDDTLRD